MTAKEVLVIVDGVVFRLQPDLKDDDVSKLKLRLEEFVNQSNDMANRQDDIIERMNDLTKELVHLKEKFLTHIDRRCDHCGYVGEGERGSPCPNCTEGHLR